MTKKAESKKQNDEVKEVLEAEFIMLDEKKNFDIILFSTSGMVKNDTQKNVSGSVANVLIKKGFAKLKTT